MPRSSADQIPFRYRPSDTPTGVTRETARRLGQKLGVDETQVIHMALRELAVRVLPQYERDDGPLPVVFLASHRRTTGNTDGHGEEEVLADQETHSNLSGVWVAAGRSEAALGFPWFTALFRVFRGSQLCSWTHLELAG